MASKPLGGMLGPIIGGVVGAKSSLRKGKISGDMRAAANRMLPFISETAGDLKKWGEEDWDHFKQTYRPVADALVDDANQAPDSNRYEREATLATARGVGDANAAIRSDVSRSGAGAGSGRFAAATLKVAADRGRGEGVGQALGRQHAEQVQTNKKLNVIDMGRPDPSSAIAGLGVVTKGGAEYGKYSAAIGRSAGESLGNAGFGIGKAIGSYHGGNRNNGYPQTNPSSGWDEPSYNDDPGTGSTYGGGGDYGDAPADYADGGIIRGPGTGRSDSIPAVIDGQRPARVSNGEYHIAANVVARIGKPRLERLISLARG